MSYRLSGGGGFASHRLLLDGLPGAAHRSGSCPVARGSLPYGSWKPRVTNEGTRDSFINLAGGDDKPLPSPEQAALRPSLNLNRRKFTIAI